MKEVDSKIKRLYTKVLKEKLLVVQSLKQKLDGKKKGIYEVSLRKSDGSNFLLAGRKDEERVWLDGIWSNVWTLSWVTTQDDTLWHDFITLRLDYWWFCIKNKYSNLISFIKRIAMNG